MVARRRLPPEVPDPAESPRDLAELAALEQLVRRNRDEWVRCGLVVEMPVWEPMRFLGCSR